MGTYLKDTLTLKALRWLNAELEPRGLRVCSKCQGHPKPLTTEYFHLRTNGRFQYICNDCYREYNREYARNRYKNDPDYRAKKGSWWFRASPEGLESNRAKTREYKRRKKAEKMSLIIRKAKP